MPDDKVKAVCIQRTEDAKAKVEREIQDMRHEREMQIAETNKNVSDLNTALAILTKDVTSLVGDAKEKSSRMDNQDKLIATSQEQMTAILSWQKEELARHTREEIEKKEAIAKVEQDRKERSKPWLQLVFNILEKFVWILLTGALAWMAYMLAIAKRMVAR
jgi:lipopolysaccharide export LptBFGC system permease protein LptF